MEPTDRSDPDATFVPETGLEALSSALKTGKLVDLLRSHGLSKSIIDVLLTPESALELQAILHDHLVTTPDALERSGGRFERKVLVFRAREERNRCKAK